MLPPIPSSSGFEVLWLPFRRTGTLDQSIKTVAQTLPLQKGGDVPEQLMPSLESSPLLVPISSRKILPRWVSLTDHGETVGPTGPIRRLTGSACAAETESPPLRVAKN